MEVSEANALIERARALPEGRRRVYTDSPEYAALVNFCPHLPVKAWRSMAPTERWAWLTYLTAPGMALDEAEVIVSADAALISDESMMRIQLAAEAMARGRALAEETRRKRLEEEWRQARAIRNRELDRLFPPSASRPRLPRRRTYRGDNTPKHEPPTNE